MGLDTRVMENFCSFFGRAISKYSFGQLYGQVQVKCLLRLSLSALNYALMRYFNFNGMQEVRSSTLLCSTTHFRPSALEGLFYVQVAAFVELKNDSLLRDLQSVSVKNSGLPEILATKSTTKQQPIVHPML
jgi:hypothetical protein